MDKTAKQIDPTFTADVYAEWDNIEIRQVDDIRTWRVTIFNRTVLYESAAIVLGIVPRNGQWEMVML